MELSEELKTNEYIRQRLQPRRGDPDYLCLIDLLDAVRELAPLDAPRVLDYGCGGSPYRSLFTGEIYHRADLAGDPTLDFAYGPDSKLPDALRDYDFVLSSQVLEHVIDPAAYLRECLRVLRPGGSLLVTTHGTFWDHACPHDYWRWTAYGLRKQIQNAGFELAATKKITTGTRAALFLFEQKLNRRFGDGDWYGVALSRLLGLIRWLGPQRLHRFADQALAENRIVDAMTLGEDAEHALYIGVCVLARKPLA